jgi:hypothetical protein
MAYAYMNKSIVGTPLISIPRLNQQMDHITTTYTATFSDGTNLEILHKNYDKDPISQTLKYDHIALFKIN